MTCIIAFVRNICYLCTDLENMGNKIVYRSKIDWWAWLCFVGVPALLWITAIDMPWWYSVFICGGMTALCLVAVLGCWYEIADDELVIYQFFRPTYIPVSKIKDVKKTTGYLATAGMSRRRVAIRLSDRSVLKSYAPVEISPKDRDGFIARLIAMNPSIKDLSTERTS